MSEVDEPLVKALLGRNAKGFGYEVHSLLSDGIAIMTFRDIGSAAAWVQIQGDGSEVGEYGAGRVHVRHDRAVHELPGAGDGAPAVHA